MSDQGKAGLVLSVIAVAIGFCLYMFGYDEGMKRIHREAVERGFATWTNSVDGKATFVWKEAVR